MNPSKAPGRDGITAGLLRKTWPVLAGRITSLFGDALSLSTFPNSLKSAELVLLIKNNDKDKSEPKSHRPVSLLSTLSKSLETLIVSRFKEGTGARMCGDQHGFTAGKSTVTAMDAVLDWADACPNRYVVSQIRHLPGHLWGVRQPVVEGAL